MEEKAPEYFITQEELDECPDYDPLRAIDDAVILIASMPCRTGAGIFSSSSFQACCSNRPH